MLISGRLHPIRTTSAHAENTRVQVSMCATYRNYLRARGEYASELHSFLSDMELPPRARRIPRVSNGRYGRVGTTSACAENTRETIRLIEEARNYLRVRGEYGVSIPPGASFEELPPRARRIPDEGGFTLDSGGTTSACAENTSDAGDGAENKRNYLRVRGEYIQTELTLGIDGELPPRARRIPAGRTVGA